jgi:hypothetical protein
MIQKKWFLVIGGLLIGWAFDFLFWRKTQGISLPLWIGVVLLAGVGILIFEKVKPAWQNILLMAGAVGMSLFTALRLEPFTRFVTFCITFASLFVLTFSYQKAYWISFRIRDYGMAFFQMLGGMFSRGFGFLCRSSNSSGVLRNPSKNSIQKKAGSTAGSILLGVGIAIPILAILIALLSSADLVFSSQLQRIIESLHLEKLPEWIFRFVYIIILAFFVIGLWLHAGMPKKPENPEMGKKTTQPFLGWISSIIPLCGIIILFLLFVVLQFWYLFGAQTNISIEGFTYAEYARRGFFELLAISIITIGIDLAFSAMSMRQGKTQESIFIALRVAMMMLVLVIIASAILRLTLYENAYGFSRIRTWSHIFIFWIGGLILGNIVLILIKKARFFGLAVVLVLFGYGTTLAVINVDGFIAGQNIQRSQAGNELDLNYLLLLSDDAVPALIQGFHDGKNTQDVKDILGANLACRWKNAQDSGHTDWQSFHFGEAIAIKQLSEIRNELIRYPVTENNIVWAGGREFFCNSPEWID